LNNRIVVNLLDQIDVNMAPPPRATLKDRRSGIERRQFSYAAHIPERRECPERRKHTTTNKP